VIRVADLDVVIGLDIAGGDRALTFLAQYQLASSLPFMVRRHALEVQQDLDHVFLHTLDSRVLVQNAVDLDLGDRAAGHGRQQNATQGIAQRVAETTLQRLQGDLGTCAALLRYVDLARESVDP
jgi:hypothetical protein